MMVTQPRVPKCRQYSQFNCPKGEITRHFHNVAQNGMIPCHSHLNGGVWSDQSNQNKRNQRGVLTLEQGLSKEHSITKRLPHKWSWPIRTIKVFESYANASSNQLEVVITQDDCRTRLLRPLIWNSLLCTTVQCYITISTGATHRKGQSISQQVQANCIT
jgi:hypothetical protein